MNVEFKYINGRQRTMNRRYADVLSKLGHGTYMTREMRATEPAPVVSAQEQPEPDTVDLDAMEADALHALAQERGVKVHHKAGADKVRDALRQAK